MGAGTILLLPVFIVIILAGYMVYIYFDQYRHASNDEKIALRNKSFKASNHYELTDSDKQKIATGEYKIEYAKDTQKIPTPLIVLIVVFLVYYGLNGLLKKYIKDICNTLSIIMWFAYCLYQIFNRNAYDNFCDNLFAMVYQYKP